MIYLEEFKDCFWVVSFVCECESISAVCYGLFFWYFLVQKCKYKGIIHIDTHHCMEKNNMGIIQYCRKNTTSIVLTLRRNSSRKITEIHKVTIHADSGKKR